MSAKLKIVLFLSVCLTSNILAQVPLATKSGYLQNFDTLSSTGTAGTLVPWNDNSTIPGWYAYKTRNSFGPPASYFVDDGSSGTGGEGLRGYGSLSTGQTNPKSDRALGELSSTHDTLIYSFALRMINSTGDTIKSLSISFRAEQWRQNTGTRGIVFDYQVGASSVSNGTWVSVPALDFLPLKIGAAGALDGNAPGNFTSKMAFISATILPGQEIWLRWTKQGTASCGLAVDDLSIQYEPTSQPSNLIFNPVTSTTLSGAFTPSVPAADGYLILQKKDSAPSAIPVDGVSYSSGAVLGDALVVNSGSETTFTSRGLLPSTTYHYAIFSYNGQGAAINYLSFDPLKGSGTTKTALSSLSSDITGVPDSEAPVISSLINDDPPLTAATGIRVWQLTVRDGGGTPDSDTKPTLIRDLHILKGPGNSAGEWNYLIRAADLFYQDQHISSAVITDSALYFANANIAVSDDSSKTLSLRISLKKSAVPDNKIIQFTMTPSCAITESDTVSSQMSDFQPFNSSAVKNIIGVVASKLNYSVQPGTVVVGKIITPAVTIQAADINNNTDADYVSPVTVSANGSLLSNSPVVKMPVNGTAEFDSLTLLTPSFGVTLSAVSGTFASVSDPFDVLSYRNYYIDALIGSDSFSGLTPQAPWKSLEKVNTTVFQPGDSILFKSGQTWTGQLKPKGSGDSVLAIVIGMYGGTAKPVINGGGVTGEGAVYLYNQEYIEISDLEIINDASSAGDRRGILVAASNFGLVEHIYLKNLYIHNIKGIVGDNDAAKRTAGIGFEVTGDAVTPTRFNNIRIDNCTIANIENTGIYTDNRIVRNDYPNTPGWHSRKYTNIRITRNTLHHISKNAMIIRLAEGGLIEYNVCYETATGTTGNTMFTVSCNGTVFQYNEAYYNRASLQGGDFGDGSMYDADLQSINCIFQYSYSHDNSHGLFWQCTVQQDSGNIVRYNVSKNDKGIIFCVNYPNTSLYIYNNTVYSYNLTPTFISERNLNAGTRKYHFYNNIIYNLSPNAKSYDLRASGYTRIIDNNIYYGFHPGNEPNDAHKITSDPFLVNASSSFSTGLNSVLGLALRANSPAINSGVSMPFHPAKDYSGNTVNTDSVDRGAFEYTSPVSAAEQNMYEKKYILFPNYPNPFGRASQSDNPATKIQFYVPDACNARLEVFNPVGELVATIFDGWVNPGLHSADFGGERYPSGIYYYRIMAGSFVEIKKMILMK